MPALLGLLPSCAESSWQEQREALVAEIRRDVQDTSVYTGIPALDPRVLEAIASVPRHEFVPPPYRALAYENRPLPIGEGQTISQPYIVALMTHLLGVDGTSRVLEIGTGSGYQAAVLARLVAHVYSIEIVPRLGREAADTLERLDYSNVTVKVGDGYQGWPEFAPFDGIVVTAAPETVPPPLVEQLAPGGRLVVPVGPDGGAQSLQVLEKTRTGELRTRHVLPVRFVPFTRDEAGPP